ncbi:MAG: hypothetical protein R6U61_08380 [Thermoplasmata archaeon]
MNKYIDKEMFTDIDLNKNDILDQIQEFLFPGQVEIQGTGYERSIIDRRIEKYLDEHFEEYIEEFNLVRELDLEIYEDRYKYIVDSIDDLKEFQMDIDTDITDMKRKLRRIEAKI